MLKPILVPHVMLPVDVVPMLLNVLVAQPELTYIITNVLKSAQMVTTLKTEFVTLVTIIV
jgi:hypothetical protein